MNFNMQYIDRFELITEETQVIFVPDENNEGLPCKEICVVRFVVILKVTLSRAPNNY